MNQIINLCGSIISEFKTLKYGSATNYEPIYIKSKGKSGYRNEKTLKKQFRTANKSPKFCTSI